MLTATTMVTTTTTTSTTTSTPNSTSNPTIIHLPSPSLDRAHFENRAHALLKIREQFHHPQSKCFDLLSQKLSIWIKIFRRNMSPHSLESVERIQALIAPYLTYLDKKILRDELRSAKPDTPVVFLQRPVIAQREALEEKQPADADEDLVWEENVYLRCRVVCREICPFSGRPMPKPTSHAYAQAVIDWKAILFSRDAREHFFNRDVTVMKLPTQEEEAEERQNFEELADYLRLRRAAKKMKQQTQAILRTVEVSEQQTYAVLARRMDEVALEEERSAQHLQRIKEYYQAQLDEKTRLMVSQQQSYKDTMRFLETYLEKAEKDNLATAAAIRGELDNVRRQGEQTHQAQQAAIAALKAEETQKLAEFQAQQALMETRHQTELLQQQNLHKQIEAGIRKEVGDLKSEVTATQKDLSLSQEVTKQLKCRVGELDAANTSLKKRVVDAEKRAKNPKKVVVCALM